MASLGAAYRDAKTRAQIRAHFASGGALKSVSLQKIFTPNAYAALAKALRGAKFGKEEDYLSRRCLRAPLPAAAAKILASPEMKSLLADTTGRRVHSLSAEALAFGRANYAMRDEPTASQREIILSLTPSWDEPWGGVVTYIDQDGGTLQVPSAPNTLTVISRPKSISRFVTYVNHYAKNRKARYVIASLS